MNILEEMYENDLFNFIDTENMGEDFHATLDRLVKAENHLVETYPDCKHLLEEYQSAKMDLDHLAHRNEFCKCFRAGTLPAPEILNFDK